MIVFEKLFPLKMVVQLIGLKSIYQILYLFFVLIVMKSLNVSDYGLYSYILSIILFFSSFPLLGFPLYLQRNVAKKHEIKIGYLYIAFLNTCIGFSIAYLILPDIPSSQKFSILMIITYNSAVAILVAMNDGVGRYSRQYLYLLLSSIWMFVCVFQYIILKKTLTIHLIIHYWFLNSSFILILALSEIFFFLRKQTIVRGQRLHFYSMIMMDLFLMYAVNIPDVFAKFFDKYLANHYLDHTFLGNYSFNLMIVATAYAFFVRPINSFLISNLARAQDSLLDSARTIGNYYLFSLSIYLGVYFIYDMASEQILRLFGLYQYHATLYIFKICFLNNLLYLLSYPFIILLAMGQWQRLKIIYCLASLLIFNIPLLFLCYASTIQHFLLGFCVAFSCNLGLILVLQYQYALGFAAFLFQLIKHSTHQAYLLVNSRES